MIGRSSLPIAIDENRPTTPMLSRVRVVPLLQSAMVQLYTLRSLLAASQYEMIGKLSLSIVSDDMYPPPMVGSRVCAVPSLQSTLPQ